MKNAPFSITPIILVLLVTTAIMGALVTIAAQAIGITGFLGFFLAGFLPVPINGIVRQILGSSLAKSMNIKGKSPVAGPLVFRLGIAALIAAILAYLLSISSLYNFGIFTGILIALATSAILAMIFVAIVALRK